MKRSAISLILAVVFSGCLGAKHLVPTAPTAQTMGGVQSSESRTATDQQEPSALVPMPQIYRLGQFRCLSATGAPIMLFQPKSSVLLPQVQIELQEYGELLAARKLSVIFVTYGGITPAEIKLHYRRYNSLRDTLVKSGVLKEQIGHGVASEFLHLGTCPDPTDCADLFLIIGLVDPSEPDTP